MSFSHRTCSACAREPARLPGSVLIQIPGFLLLCTHASASVVLHWPRTNFVTVFKIKQPTEFCVMDVLSEFVLVGYEYRNGVPQRTELKLFQLGSRENELPRHDEIGRYDFLLRTNRFWFPQQFFTSTGSGLTPVSDRLVTAEPNICCIKRSHVRHIYVKGQPAVFIEVNVRLPVFLFYVWTERNKLYSRPKRKFESIGGSRRRFFGSLGERMGIGGAGFHFMPLERYEKTGKKVDADDYPCPPKRRPLVATQFSLYILEFIGGLECFWALNRLGSGLGSLDFWTTVQGYLGLAGNIVFAVHGGVSVTDKLTSLNASPSLPSTCLGFVPGCVCFIPLHERPLSRKPKYSPQVAPESSGRDKSPDSFSQPVL